MFVRARLVFQMKLQNEEHKVLHLQRALAAKQGQLLELHRQHQVDEQQHKVGANGICTYMYINYEYAETTE